MNHDLTEKVLKHIRNILGHLEHMGVASRAIGIGTVSTLNYWRARIQAILDMPLLPLHIEKQVQDLFVRLNRLEYLRR